MGEGGNTARATCVGVFRHVCGSLQLLLPYFSLNKSSADEYFYVCSPKCAYACSRLPVTVRSCTALAVSYLLMSSVNPHVVHVPLCNARARGLLSVTVQQVRLEKKARRRSTAAHERCDSRVTEVPAEVPLWQGGRGPAADSQGHTVDVSARSGMEAGVETICHAGRTGDAVKETGELIGRVELHSGMIRTRISYQKNNILRYILKNPII